MLPTATVAVGESLPRLLRRLPRHAVGERKQSSGALFQTSHIPRADSRPCLAPVSFRARHLFLEGWWSGLPQPRRNAHHAWAMRVGMTAAQ